jgi:diketogulonate reductase-like aldo/keto reductase
MEAYRALEALLGDRKVRAIGVSNFMVQHLTTLLKRSTVVPAVHRSRSIPTSCREKCRASAPSRAS